MNNEVLFFNISGISVFISFWLYAFSWLNKKRSFTGKLASVLLSVSFIFLTAALIIRGIALQYFPISNLYESLLIFAWALILVFLLMEKKFNIQSFGWASSGMLLIIFLYASWSPASQKAILPLVPALKSYWRVIHVPPLLVSYSLFLLSAIAALGYLIEASFFAKGSESKIITKNISGAEVKSTISQISPRAHFCDEITYRCITFGFPLLTFGVITGGLWANHAWGALWQWDPKETMALVTWFVYAAYLHFRLNTKVSPSVLAWISLLGVVMVYLTYLGVNQFNLGGLHTYGKI